MSCCRGLVLKNFILNECSDSVRLTSDRIILKDGAENWQGLTDMVDSRYSRHDREKVLRILADTSVGPETRKWRLKQLDGGYTWDYLYRHYMPSLRTSTVICVYVTLEESEIPVLQEEAPVVVPQEPEQEPIPEPVPDPVPSPQPAPRQTRLKRVLRQQHREVRKDSRPALKGWRSLRCRRT